MDRDISLDAIKLVACIFVCTLHTIGMFMSESSDFHLSYLLFYMSGIAVPLFFMVNGFLLAPKDGGMKYYYRKIFNIVKIVCVFTFIFDIPKLVRGDISILIPFKQACSSLFFQGGVFPVFWFLGSLIFIYALMPFLKKYIISIRTRLYGLLLFLSVLQFIIYTCDIYTNYVYSFIFENVYIPQSFRLYSHLMYFLLGVCLRLYLTDNNMLKNVIGNTQEVGLYTVAVRIVRAISMLFACISTVILPRVTYYLGQGQKDKFDALIYKTLNFILLLAIPSGLGLISISEPLVTWFGGSGFTQAYRIVSVLAFSVIFSALNRVFAWQILVPYNREKEVFYSTAAGAMVNFVLNLFFISRWGAVGAAATTVISEFVVFLMCTFQCRNVISCRVVGCADYRTFPSAA